MLCLFCKSMKYGSGKGRHKESASGRKIIIAIVVVTSALSFTLGYFVGRTVIMENPAQPQLIAMPSQQETVSVPQIQPVQSSGQPLQNSEQEVAASPQPQIKEGKLPSDKGKGQPIQTTAVKAAAKPVIKEDRTREEKPVQNETVYTVQAGAFKNSKDAVNLKLKLENKGYKVYIKKSVEAKNLKLYKIRTGEFAEKEKAETLALKLKKEGLNAFVTTKNGEAHGEDKKSSQPRAANKQENPR